MISPATGFVPRPSPLTEPGPESASSMAGGPADWLTNCATSLGGSADWQLSNHRAGLLNVAAAAKNLIYITNLIYT